MSNIQYYAAAGHDKQTYNSTSQTASGTALMTEANVWSSRTMTSGVVEARVHPAMRATRNAMWSNFIRSAPDASGVETGRLGVLPFVLPQRRSSPFLDRADPLRIGSK